MKITVSPCESDMIWSSLTPIWAIISSNASSISRCFFKNIIFNEFYFNTNRIVGVAHTICFDECLKF